MININSKNTIKLLHLDEHHKTFRKTLLVSRISILHHFRRGHCVADIGHWMAANRLQMNPTKTGLLCGHRLQTQHHNVG